MSDYRHEILSAGGATLMGWTNVAPGTFGYEVKRLERDGLLRSELVRGVLRSEDAWRFTLTEEGEKTLAHLDAQRL